MSKVDWSNAPKDADCYDIKRKVWLKKENDNIYFRHVNGVEWSFCANQIWAKSDYHMFMRDNGCNRAVVDDVDNTVTQRTAESSHGVDWSKAPKGAQAYNGVISLKWLRKVSDRIEYHIDDIWVPYNTQALGLIHWGESIKRPVTDEIDDTVTQRGERYGLFADGAVIMQDLKAVMRATPGWERLTPSQREALEMIQHKIGRVLNGDPMYDDSWRDISGYATLILNELNGVKR